MDKPLRVKATGVLTRLGVGRDLSTDDPWSRYLFVDGAPAFFIGGSCDTCAFLFERKTGVPSDLPPEVVAGRLADGDDLLNPELLAAIGAVLPADEYLVLVRSVRPRLVRPCDADDYFSSDLLAGWPIDPQWGVPDTPRTYYYRDRTTTLPERFQGYGTTATRRFFSLLVPIAAPLDPDRVEEYRHRIIAGERPAALALGILDVRLPADPHPGLEWQQHLCLTQYVLDGHHKIAAAAAIGEAVQVLLFLAPSVSIASADDVERVLQILRDEEEGEEES